MSPDFPSHSETPHPISDVRGQSPSGSVQPFIPGISPKPWPDTPVDRPESEVDQLAAALACRFEELSLIHGLTQRLANSLTLIEEPSNIALSLLEELAPCIDSDTLGIHLFPDTELPVLGSHGGEAGEIFEWVGEPISRMDVEEVGKAAAQVAALRTGSDIGVALVNDLRLSGSAKRVRAAVVPIRRQSVSLGKMIAIRCGDRQEFGTIEADMMLSTSMMLAVHLINQRQYTQLQNMYQGMIQSLASALEAKDSYTCGHSNRVANLSYKLAAMLGYSPTQLGNIHMAGVLHDIGKIGIDDSVLQKPGRLTEEEFDQIKKHPVLGYEILKGVDYFRGILPAVRHHHESWDGTGYPDGLAADEIPRDAQIMAVADAFDAMTSDRPYRNGLPIGKVVEIFREGRGRQWAADVVDVLLSSSAVDPDANDQPA